MKKWIVGVCIYALVIHILYSISPINEWTIAKWSAGDILTFGSTVGLGLLALWQNKRFKEENDISQKRLEELTRQANELAAINKIIEYEWENIIRLRTATNKFIETSDTTKIIADFSELAIQEIPFKNIKVKVILDERYERIRLSGMELLSEVARYTKDENAIELTDQIKDYFDATAAFIKILREEESVLGKKDIGEKKEDMEKELLSNVFKFIMNREALLNKIIYGNLTLDQVKEICGENINEGGAVSGKDENGIG